MDKKLKILGRWSAGGTLMLLASIAYLSGALTTIISELTWFFSGQAVLLAAENFSLLEMALLIAAAISLTVPLSYLGYFIQWLFLGKAKGGHWLSEMFAGQTAADQPPAKIFLVFFMMVLVEELFARWLFLGVLTKILPGSIGFIALFLLGNGLWALMHKYNFLNIADQKNLRVLPQFLMGIMFSFIFVKYGLLASILTHFGHNAIIFALGKKDKVESWHWLLFLYYGALTVIFFSLQTQALSDIASWFASIPTFHLVGWSFWDYLFLDLFFLGLINVVSMLLCYDGLGINKFAVKGFRDNFNSHLELWRRNKLSAIFNIALIPIILSLLQMTGTYGLYWLCGFITTNVPYRILVLTLVLCLSQGRSSGNAMARDFWANFPSVYLLISIIQALGSVQLVFCFILFRTLINIPASALIINRALKQRSLTSVD